MNSIQLTYSLSHSTLYLNRIFKFWHTFWLLYVVQGMLQATTIVTRDGWRFWYQTITIYLKQHWIKMAYKKGKRQTHYFLQLHGSYQNYEFSYIEPHLFVAPLNLKQIIYDIRFILFIAGLVYARTIMASTARVYLGSVRSGITAPPGCTGRKGLDLFRL